MNSCPFQPMSPLRSPFILISIKPGWSSAKSFIILVEMKTTKKPIKDSSLAGFFFGATQREYDLAAKLGDKFRFAFVVLNSNNIYNKPFAVLLTLQELEIRTRSKRIQYQVNLWNKKDAKGTSSITIV